LEEDEEEEEEEEEEDFLVSNLTKHVDLRIKVKNKYSE
jgi:hypothetical protein